jgi:hypothetical protein
MNRRGRREAQSVTSDARMRKKEAKDDKKHVVKKKQVNFRRDDDYEEEKPQQKPGLRKPRAPKARSADKAVVEPISDRESEKTEERQFRLPKPNQRRPPMRDWGVETDDGINDDMTLKKQIIKNEKFIKEQRLHTVPVAILQASADQNSVSVDEDEKAVLSDALPTYVHDLESKQALSFELTKQRYENTNPGKLVNQDLTIKKNDGSFAPELIGGFFTAYLAHLKAHVQIKDYYGDVGHEITDLVQKLLFFLPPNLRVLVTKEKIANLVQMLRGETGRIEPKNLPSLNVKDQIMASRVTSNIAWFAKAIMIDMDEKRQSLHRYVDFVSAIGAFGVAVAAANSGRSYQVHNVCPYPVQIGFHRCMQDFVLDAVRMLADNGVIDKEKTSLHAMSIGKVNAGRLGIEKAVVSNAKVDFFLCADKFVSDFVENNITDSKEDSLYIRLSLSWKKDLHWSYYHSEENTKPLLAFVHLLSNLMATQSKRKFVVSLSLPSARTLEKDASIHFLNALRYTSEKTQPSSQTKDTAAAFSAGSGDIYCYGLHDQDVNHLHFSPKRPYDAYVRVWQKSMFSCEFSQERKTFEYREYPKVRVEQKYGSEPKVGYGYYRRSLKHDEGVTPIMYRLSPFIRDGVRGEADSLYKQDDKDKQLSVMFKFIELPAQIRRAIMAVLQPNLKMSDAAHRSMSYRQADALLDTVRYFLPKQATKTLVVNPGVGALSIRVRETYNNLSVAYTAERNAYDFLHQHRMIVRAAIPSYNVTMQQDQIKKDRVFPSLISPSGYDWVHYCYDWSKDAKNKTTSERVRLSCLADLPPFNDPLDVSNFDANRWFLFIMSYTMPRPLLSPQNALERKLTTLEVKEGATPVPIARYEVNHNLALADVVNTFEVELQNNKVEILVSVSGLMYYVYLFYVRLDNLMNSAYTSRVNRHEWFRRNLPASALTSAFLFSSYDEKTKRFSFKDVQLVNPFLV